MPKLFKLTNSVGDQVYIDIDKITTIIVETGPNDNYRLRVGMENGTGISVDNIDPLEAQTCIKTWETN